MIYLPVKDLKNIYKRRGNCGILKHCTVSADDDGKLGPAELTEGSFDYAKKELKVGDIVCIYAGLRPDKRTLDTPDNQNGDVAYVEVTGRMETVTAIKMHSRKMLFSSRTCCLFRWMRIRTARQILSR